MKIPLYAYRDLKSGFGAPFSDKNDQVATRSMRLAVATDPQFAAIKNDIQLFRLGDFETDDASFEVSDLPVLLLDGSQIGADIGA